jgi:hypothetical protein
MGSKIYKYWMLFVNRCDERRQCDIVTDAIAE